ncbi:hypothetical protein GCM10010954_32360 [Halobacillus andaensis]|uniref:SEC-C motif-containing protein n=1 Tax=Halobacillus andaensis TaxID=1176239 RepID=A0A917B8Q6_HALAA|nr:SEC-C metal-binding domain-containing protein [Halobacillus andaensis]MBP2005342.1 hypothetical protein [Halobacillus andaensis]GGF30734.1 hypothetical protein GCM10010954_32360 [Halobacillus andaensis]
MTKVGRNDPCPCGSGKKYKKCHGQSNVIDFPAKVIEEELDQHFLRFQDFMFDQYPHLFPRVKPTTDEEEVEQFITLLYKGLFEVQNGEETVFQQYLHENESSIQRPSVSEALRSWQESKASIFKMLNYDGESIIEVEDVLFGGTYKVDRDRIPLKVKDFAIAPYYTGILLNYGPIYKFAPMAVPVEERSYQAIRMGLEQDFEEQADEESLKGYFHAAFLYQLPQWIYFDEDNGLETIWKGKPAEREVLDLIDQSLEQEFKEEGNYQLLKDMWIMFCNDESPVIRKSEVFAASLEYCYKTSSYFWKETETSKRAIAEKYSVSPNSLSKRYDELKDYFEEKILS